MSRSKHQFRPDTPEVFEERITPSVTPVVGQIPFIPPGQVVPYTPVQGYTYGPGTNGGPFTVSGTNNNTISITMTNTTTVGHYLTFTIYDAPGGGNNTAGNAYDNLSSQRLIYSETHFVDAGASYTFMKDVSTLPTSGPNKINGQDKIQCDVWQSPTKDGYAPEHGKDGDGNNLIIGELFDWQGKKN